MKKLSIVVIDDQSEVTEVIHGLLDETELGDCTKISFVEPLKALDYIKRNYRTIAVVCSDYQMESLNGIDLYRKLPSEAQEIPFLLITGYFSKELAEEAMEAGVRGVIEKPLNLEKAQNQIVRLGRKRIDSVIDELEMVEGFLEETLPMLDEIESLILDLESHNNQAETLRTYFRLLHTIKGTAACIGLTKMASFTHEYESYITELSKHPMEIDGSVVSALLVGFDSLKKMAQSVADLYTDAYSDAVSHVETFLLAVQAAKNKVVKSKTPETKEAPKNSSVVESTKESDKITVAIKMLDEFMETSGELTVLKGAVFKTIEQLDIKYRGDEDFERLRDLMDSMHKVSSGLQNQIMEMRKVSLGTIFRPYKRLVRDLSLSLNKEVELEIHGDDLLVDSSIAKLWSNTLIHLLRNGLDHGIETPDQRLEMGKPAKGLIKINAYESGEFSFVEIKDDGKGLNRKLLEAKAVEKGLFSIEELAPMSDEEVYDLIFHSGFSTAAVVTDVSGRGVGMDMVKSSVLALGGEVTIQSQLGKGTLFTLMVPVPKSILIIKSLVVCSGDHPYLIPMDDIVELLVIDDMTNNSRIEHVENSVILQHHGMIYPLVSLRELTSGAFEEMNSIVILRAQGVEFALMVDEVKEFEEVVIRPISSIVESKELFVGSSLIGNGVPCTILSSEGMLEFFKIENKGNIKQVNSRRVNKWLESKDYSSSEFLLFDLESYEGCALPLDQVDRVETLKVDQVSFSGNQPVFYYRDKIAPLIIPGFATKRDDLQRILAKGQTLSVIIFNRGNHPHGLLVSTVKDIFECKDEIHTEVTEVSGIVGCLYLDDRVISVVDLDALMKEVKTTPEAELEIRRAA